jgi:hypothetical protein
MSIVFSCASFCLACSQPETRLPAISLPRRSVLPLTGPDYLRPPSRKFSDPAMRGSLFFPGGSKVP